VKIENRKSRKETQEGRASPAPTKGLVREKLESEVRCVWRGEQLPAAPTLALLHLRKEESSSLYFLAWGALGNVGEAEEAIGNCYRKACRQPQRFASEGEFGSWMIRLLINEIVLVANQRNCARSELSEVERPVAR